MLGFGIRALCHSCLSPYCSSCKASGIPAPLCPLSRQPVCFVQRLYAILLTLFHWLSRPEWAIWETLAFCAKGTLALLSEENKACCFALLPPDAIRGMKYGHWALCALEKKKCSCFLLKTLFAFLKSYNCVVFLFLFWILTYYQGQIIYIIYYCIYLHEFVTKTL